MNLEDTIRIDCLVPQRLIERAVARGARLSAVDVDDARRVTVRCDAASTKILLALCERYSIPARIVGRGAGGAMTAFARRRRTLLIAAAVFLALCMGFLSRVWRVDVAFSGEAAEYGDRTALLDALSAAGIAPGTPRRAIDPGLLAQRLQGEAGRFSYVGVHLHGVHLTVEAAPEVPAPTVYDVNAARDLVSDRDGIVVQAVARSGELCVKPGDAVRRGQLLIRGEEKRSAEETRPIAALGEVIVRAWYEGEAALPLSSTVFRSTGRRSYAARLTAPFADWPIVEGETFEFQTVETVRLPVGGLFVPLEIERCARSQTRPVAVEIDREALRVRLAALACSDAARKLCAREKRDCEITDRWVNYVVEGGAMHAKAVIEIRADAAVSREVLQGG